MASFSRLLSLFAIFLVLPGSVLAAQVRLAPEMSQHPDQIILPVMLDAPENSVNTLAFEITWPQAIALSDIRDSASVVSFWIRQELSDNRALFEGIIPGGVQGKDLPLVEMHFASTNESILNQALFQIDQVKLFSGPGKVLPAAVNGQLAVEVSLDASLPPPLRSLDTLPPAQLFAEIISARDSGLSQDSLIFHASDDRSTIASYQLQIGKGDFQTVTSPHLLEPQDKGKVFTLRALDGQGNSSEVYLLYGEKTLQNSLLYTALLAIFGIKIEQTLR